MKPIIVALLLTTCELAQQTANEKAAWQGEESYWRYLKAGDKASFMALWSDRFTGWPRMESAPTGKQRIGELVPAITPTDYKLTPLSVREYGNQIVITFYRVTSTSNAATVTARITHTWMRNGDKWQIIGGMSASEDGGTALNK